MPLFVKQHRSAILSSEELREWAKPDSRRLALELALIWAQIVVPFVVFCCWPNPFTFGLAFVLIAGGQQGLGLAAHEFVHYTAIPHNRKLNDWIGQWFFSAPVGVPFHVFRARHFAHHRHYSSEDDTKTLYRHDIRGWRLWREILVCLTGWEFISHGLEVMRQQRKPEEDPKGDVGPILLTQLVLLSLASLVNPIYYLVLWLLPLVTLFTLLRKFRIIMEHQPSLELGTDHATGYFRNTPDRFVRTVTASPIERLMLSHLNFCYHAEHHLWPQLSYQHLPKIRQRLRDCGAFQEEPGLEERDTYMGTILRLWREPSTR